VTNEQHKEWTEEALEALRNCPEANPSLLTTETAAWRSGFVAGYLLVRKAEYERQEHEREWD